MARGESIEVRKNALFWAGQTGGIRGAELQELYESLTDMEMKEQVIFVASQTGEAEAMDFLMEVATNEEDAELRKRAVFWRRLEQRPAGGTITARVFSDDAWAAPIPLVSASGSPFGVTGAADGRLLLAFSRPDGSLGMAEGRGDLPGDVDVGMSRSTDGGRTWAPMKVILDMGDDPEFLHDGVGDPAILVDRKRKTIWVAATWSHGNRAWRGSGPGLTPAET